jgi:hypothetical protein
LGSHKGVVTVNGLFRPFALVGGRARATWKLSGREVLIRPFGRLTNRDSVALARDAAEVKRFLSGAR